VIVVPTSTTRCFRSMDAADSLAFVDLETTGGNPAFHRITEIGIVRVVGGEVVEEWSSLVNPQCEIPAYIQAFTGISNQMVAGAPVFAELAATVMEKLRGAVFVAHNARFDYSFLRSEFFKIGTHFSAQVLCTVKLSRRLFPQHARHNLDVVMERHGLTCSARHRALGDARVLRDLWCKLSREIPPSMLDAAVVHSILGVAKLPAHLPPQLADELPDGPGAYRFFGEADALLYVGKSHSLRTRVLRQLADENLGSRERKLADAVRRVDWVATRGELGAMLLEAEWLRMQKPLFNKRAKSSADSVTLRLSADRCGRVRAQRIDALQPGDLAQSFGVFHSEKDAHKALQDIAGAQQLCLKVLGLEQSAGSCFALQMGKCKGACTGKEPLLLHNMRVQLALSSLKIKSWPFPGRIALRERAADGRWPGGPDGSSGDEFHVLQDWAYLGTARCEEELATLGAVSAPLGFDADVYKILLRHFSNQPKLDWHHLRTAGHSASDAA
jgi:DNA polymerase III subunit epsilon